MPKQCSMSALRRRIRCGFLRTRSAIFSCTSSPSQAGNAAVLFVARALRF